MTACVRDEAGFTVAGHFGDWEVWREYLLPIYRDFLGLPAAAIGILALVALILGLRERDRRIVPLGICALLALPDVRAVALHGSRARLENPAFAGFNTRYLMPAMLVAAPLVAWLAARLPRARLPLEVVLAAGIADGVAQALDVPVKRSIAVAAILLLVGFGAHPWRARDRFRQPAARVAIAGAAALLYLRRSSQGIERSGISWTTGTRASILRSSGVGASANGAARGARRHLEPGPRPSVSHVRPTPRERG